MASPCNMTVSPILHKLPAKIRNRIYELTFVSETPINVTPTSIATNAALLRANKQIRDEASAFFYANNTFRITLAVCEKNFGLEWLKLIGKDFAASIQEVRVHFVPCPALDDVFERERLDPQLSFANTGTAKKEWLGPTATSAKWFARKMLKAGVRRKHVHVVDLDSTLALERGGPRSAVVELGWLFRNHLQMATNKVEDPRCKRGLPL